MDQQATSARFLQQRIIGEVSTFDGGLQGNDAAFEIGAEVG